MSKQKLKRLDQLINSIKSKVEILQHRKSELDFLNYKLEALDTIFNLFQIQSHKPEVSIQANEFIKEQSILSNSEDPKDENTFGSENSHFETLVEPGPEIEKRQYTFEQAVEKFFNESGKNSIYKSSVRKIISLYQNDPREYSLDEITKKCSLVRFKCSDMVKDLMNFDPPILLKKGTKNIYFVLNSFQ